ncbi:MAG: LamB/YcsF family protein [Chloracidobacterium sp.]|nr:LamB/YcsF family protein [Chloracidobacterium sp.]
MATIDINCDMGEGCPNDSELMNYVSSVNIACGAHAGDAEIMRRTVECAIEKGVAIGAHPGYADRENFGRFAIKMLHSQIYDLVTEQFNTLNKLAVDAGGKIRHLKPHGALYNQSALDSGLAEVIAQAVFDIDPYLILFGLSGSVSISEAEKLGLKTASEVFADRTYKRDGSLTPRAESNALIHDTDIAIAQVMQMIDGGTVTATDGSVVPINADTVCIHGDGDNALEFAMAIRKSLTAANINVAAMV